MPLITCQDCSNPVSPSASSCPHCGRPIAPYGVVTTQRTAKPIKFFMVLYFALFLLSALAVLGASGGLQVVGILGALVFGLCFLVASIARWWHHA